jgi:hypothetical protein
LFKKIKIPNQLKFGILGFFIINGTIKVLLYPLIVKYYPFETGIILMFISSFIFRYLIIIIYDKIKIDWLLIETLKEKLAQKRQMINQNSVTKRILKFKKFGNIFLLGLLVSTDPLITVLYYRPGYFLWNNIPDKKSFLLFTLSTAFCTTTMAISIYSIFKIADIIF